MVWGEGGGMYHSYTDFFKGTNFGISARQQ